MPRLLSLHLSMMGVLVALALVALAGCGDPCTDLQDICNQCRNPDQKAACEASVDAGSDDTCERNIDSYSNVCT